MFQNPNLVQDLTATKIADARRDHRDTRINEARREVGIRIARPLVRFLGH